MNPQMILNRFAPIAKEFAALSVKQAAHHGKKLLELLLSDQAQEVYKKIIVMIVMICAVIALGLTEAAKQHWRNSSEQRLAIIQYLQDGCKRFASMIFSWGKSVARKAELEMQSAIELACFAWLDFL